jgi:hypothetical protein
MKRREFLVTPLGLAACGRREEGAPWDVIVYGATAGGVVAAVAAAREGLKAALLEPGRHIGGMTSGGLGRTDHGRKETIGGYSLEFYKRVGRHYGEEITWYFEPKVAEKTLNEMLAEAGVRVYKQHRLQLDGGVSKRGRRIEEILMENGSAWRGTVFVDATYEGDLMAKAGASYTWGREGVNDYGESLAGVRPKDRNHQFDFPVSAYDDKGRLLADIQRGTRGELGVADKKVQAYNFRMCLSEDPKNQVPIPKPEGYDPRRYELLIRYLEGWRKHHGRIPEINQIFIWSRLANPTKTDINNRSAVSTDYIGASWDYPEANYERRGQIWQEHINYTAGLFYFYQHDPRIPKPIQEEIRRWGLAADEFEDTAHWPHQLYVREARRMVGDFVMTQKDIQTEITKPDVIGMGSYNSDSHNVQRYVQEDGTVQNEGNMEVPVTPYQIPYRVMLPKRNEVENLLVPVCVSSTHVTYSTLRMEPVYMIMGQAAGVAAKLAIESRKVVQDVNGEQLSQRLRKQGAIMEWAKPQAPG